MDIPINDLEKIITQEILKHLRESGITPNCSCEVAPVSSAPKNEKRIALILFGGLGGLAGVCQVVKSQQKKGRKISCFQTPFSHQVNGKDFLEKELPGVESVPKMEVMKSIEWLKKSQMVILGSLERTSAAKLALGITDNLETKMVYSALGLGLPVFGNTESFHKADCVLCGGENPTIEKMAGDYLKTLQQMGLVFTPVDQLNKQIDNFWEGPKALESLPTIKGVVTVDDIRDWSKPEFWICQGTILTPSAKDYLNEKNIEIVEK